MNRAEAAGVLDQLTAGYPRADLDPKAAAAWVEALVDSGADGGHASRAARSWARTNDRFPSLAEFLTVVTPRPAYRSPTEDGPLEVHPDVAKRIGRLWREALTEIDKRAAGATRGVDGHWHGGPDPCPTCGGIRPDLQRRP